MKSKVETYALTVCFASVVCLMISGGFAIFGFLRIVAPELTMHSWTYSRLQSNDQYWEGRSGSARESGKDRPRPPEPELTRERKLAYSVEVAEERHDGLQTLMRALAFATAGAVALFLHWRLARRFRNDAGST